MHKLKNATADLRAYLGRDTQGLGLLAQLERVANDVRKQAATEKDRADLAVREKASVSAALQESEHEIEQLKAQLRREQDATLQLERDVNSWQLRVSVLESERNPKIHDPNDVCAEERGRALLSAITSLRQWR